MNAKKAKTIPIEQVLYRMGIKPQKTSGDDIWYLSPFTTEKTASFKVNQKINKWYCHSSGFGGNTLDFVIKKSGCSISEALTYLKDFDIFFSFQKQIFKAPEEDEEHVDHIEKIKPIQHIALIQYLKDRGILKYENENCLKEIHYSIKDKKYFALGFRNDSGGFEVRSKYAKICLGIKDITTVFNGSKVLRVFEGFFDYLSFKQIQNCNSDYMILNSISMLEKSLHLLFNYEKIELFLDNDLQGDKATELLKNQFKNVIDGRIKYKNHKDLNEFITAK
ncbi:toprim domain-containing protein [Flavobacterium sp. J27]|uniref:toprim domain-containing protein n=1 Tax=Flavobacterium sp. J27 TaxID=2060419 RepID=UPI00102F745F|nr:toprim domain-containing protein [Flavobacterium sp. J27]